MSAEEDKAVVRRFVEELWNARRLDAAEELFHADCVTHQLRSGTSVAPVPRGPDELKRHVLEWLEGFPDLKFTAEQMVAEAGFVTTRLRMEGTHTGAWLGVEPTGRRVQIRLMTVHRIEGGKIAEDWVLVESLGFFQQLGLLPPDEEIMTRAAR
ncbi:MAG TPA: ester cyclase [Pyrinomonadaceae bacterium]|nr:ester cyclase [Pyrinomonadaceae bacterium]